MPKIDIAKLPVDSRSNYPEPFNRVVDRPLAQAARHMPPASTSSASI